MVGQIHGPFKRSQQIMEEIEKFYTNNHMMKISIYTHFPENGMAVSINQNVLTMGPEGMYEVDDWMYISDVHFLQDMPADTQVTFVTKEDML